jgi:glycosyltransferase involved in cell wall biosynthesis
LDVGIVVIGRNEGERLVQCLESVLHLGLPVVYVDSASADDSAAIARSLGADVVELDRARPFSAARSRNEGFERLSGRDPDIRFVQFLDGDCTLLPGWIEAAVRALSEQPQRSAVIGHLLERNADASVYNRLCAMEWRSAPGDLRNYGDLGGISMMRGEVFRALGGFRTDVIAGEDSELGVRMGLAGHKVTKIDFPMATHDADMRTFRQWWRRAVRAGHAIGQRYSINGRSAVRDCARERNSTLFWGIGLPLIVLATALPTRGSSCLLLAGYPVLGIRIWRYRRSVGDGTADAALYAAFMLIAKFANAAGLMKFFANKLARNYEIIEYK